MLRPLMKPIYQHPQDLSLALFKGEPQFPMTLLRSIRLNFGRWDVYMHIIGESHAVIIAKDGEPFFSEMLSCSGVQPVRCYQHFDFQTAEQITHQESYYRVSAALNAPDWEIPLPLPNTTMEMAFPLMFGKKPITRIQWQVKQGGLEWWTVHVYPLEAETVCVYSHSDFDFTYNED